MSPKTEAAVQCMTTLKVGSPHKGGRKKEILKTYNPPEGDLIIQLFACSISGAWGLQPHYDIERAGWSSASDELLNSTLHYTLLYFTILYTAH